MLGNVTATLTHPQLKRLFDNIVENRDEGVQFLFDFVSKDTDIDDNIRISESDGIIVKRKERYRRDDSNNLDCSFTYLIDDKYEFHESFTMRTHDKEKIKDSLYNAGFSDIIEINNYDYDRDLIFCSFN
jgi:hypothetical protein